jgi:hypothetical protein
MAGISGPGVSGIQIQNLDKVDSANITVELWNQDGSPGIQLSDPTSLAAGSATNVYLPNYSSTEVPSGAYAMVVSSDKPVAAIARTDWSSSGGAGIYSSVDKGPDVIVPLVVANYVGQTTQFTVQNTDASSDITVDVTLFGRGMTSPVVELTGQTIPKGTSKTWSLDDAAFGTLPDTALDLGASGFVGALQVQSTGADIVVQSFIDLDGSPGVTAFSGVPTTSGSETLFCPLIRANYYGDTGISIYNPNGSQASVEIVFRADANSPNSGVYTETLQIGQYSSEAPFQGPGGSSRTAGLPGGTQTAADPTPTDNGFYGVATISSTVPVMAVVNDTLFGSGWSIDAQSTYNCVTAGEAGTEFALPLVRSFHIQSLQLTTGIVFQNTTGNTAQVDITLTDWDGTDRSASDPATIEIPPYGSGSHWQGNLTGLPTVPANAGGYGWYGSAVVTSSEPIVVVVDDQGFGTTSVDSANYNGIKVQ